MAFRLRALSLRVATDGGQFGADIALRNGLNVLAAPNTSGKSTCIQAILFALGLEGMLGPGRDVPLPHAMTQSLQDLDGREYQVRESYVVLEIEDESGDPIVIRRYSQHGSISDKLISVWHARLSDLRQGSDATRQDFYVRRPGAAQREAGFHHFLARRIGWTLPEVPTFNGSYVPLYLETIAPLWFVEQKRGWSGIQAQTPTYLQIRDVRRRALEFTLQLDAQERARRIEILIAAQADIASNWRATVAALQGEMMKLGLFAEGLAPRPAEDWSSADVRVLYGSPDSWLPLDEHIANIRNAAERSAAPEVPTVGEVADRDTTELNSLNARLREIAAVAAENARSLELEEQTVSDAQDRLEAVDEDIRRHRDLITLQELGSDLDEALTQHDCPTCHKPLDGVLLSPEDTPSVLAAEASIRVLEGRRAMFRSLLGEARGVVEARQARMTSLRARANDIRASIRAIKQDLTSAENTPSVAVLVERLTLNQRQEELEAFHDRWLVGLESLDEMTARWRVLAEQLRELRSSEFSETDRSKLTSLELSFQRQLGEYGFRSCPVDQVGLSLDDYMPTHEGFELSLDFSASDGIRVIWAYLIGLLEVGNAFETNHPGVVVFDEPRQQAAAELSFEALMRQAAETVEERGQILFATSESHDTLNRMSSGLNLSITAYRGKILERL